MSDALDDAAAAALWMLALERDPKIEHLGALYDSEGGIARTPTVRGNNSKVRGSLRVPAGSLRALFHNHPEGTRERERTRFSQADAQQALRLGVPSYISAGHRVMRYDPKAGSVGEVLAEFPIDEFRAYVMKRLLDRSAGEPRGQP